MGDIKKSNYDETMTTLEWS